MITKSHAKNQLILTKNGREMAVLSFSTLFAFFNLTAENGYYGLHLHQMTMISKKFVLFEVSISNQPVFCADRGSAKENSDKRLFWAPEGCEVETKRAKNLQIAISRSFLARLLFPFMETFYRIYYCLRVKKFKIGETLVLRLEFTVF